MKFCSLLSHTLAIGDKQFCKIIQIGSNRNRPQVDNRRAFGLTAGINHHTLNQHVREYALHSQISASVHVCRRCISTTQLTCGIKFRKPIFQPFFHTGGQAAVIGWCANNYQKALIMILIYKYCYGGEGT